MNANEETVLDVEGMSCGSCVRHVKDALNEVEGVDAVDVQLAQGQVKVKHGDNASVDRLVEALREAGYQSSPNTGR